MPLAIDQVTAEPARLLLEEARAIAREVKADAEVVRVSLAGAGVVGRGECCPMPRYGEQVASVLAQVEAAAPALRAGLTRADLAGLMPPGAARNAVDAALWDLEAKQAGVSAESLAGLAATAPITTAYTIPIKPPAEAARVAERERHRPLIKVKLGHFDQDRARLEAIRRAAPDAALIVDANEGWSPDQLRIMAPIARDLGVRLIEQPIHASRDAELDGTDWGVPLCADESCHTVQSLDAVAGRYQYVNIKLDKTGGPTEALALARAAKARGLGLMIGSTSGATLGLAPAFLVAQLCAYCDLDAPLFLAERESEELAYDGSTLDWSPSRRWGLPI